MSHNLKKIEIVAVSKKIPRAAWKSQVQRKQSDSLVAALNNVFNSHRVGRLI